MEPDRRIDRSPDDEAGIHAFERGLDDELHAMEHESELVEEDIRRVRKEWEAMRADPSVPGARPREDSPPDDALERFAGDWSGESQAAEEAGQD